MKEDRINEYELTFSSALKQYITMGLTIWPSLKLALSNIQNACQPPPQSPIPNRNYKSMTEEQFLSTAIDDLYLYIMEHDVTAEHLSDYLSDILHILYAEEENSGLMGNQLMSLILEMQGSDYHRLLQLKQHYDFLRNANVQHHDEDSSDQDDGSSQGDRASSQGEHQDEQMSPQKPQETKQQIQQEKQEQVPQLTSAEITELKDEGWVVIPIKKNKNK